MPTSTLDYRFKVRGGTAAALASVNEIPLARELVYETDTGKAKLGDGLTAYNSLAYVGGASAPTGTGFRRIVAGVENGAASFPAESEVTFTDITNNNASTSNHGYLKKLSNVSTEFMNGQGNWATPSGGGGSSVIRGFKRVTVNGTKTVAAALIPYDNTVPTSTEGVEFTDFAFSYTPTDAASVLLIRLTLGTFTVANNGTAIFTIFNGSTLLTSALMYPGGTNLPDDKSMEYSYAPGSASAVSLTVRAGTNASTTVRINTDGTANLGETISSTLSITEFAP